MDNFMDKLAQKFNAGEMIKANTQAETLEMQKMKEQMQQYDNCLQEMRKVTLKNVEMADQVQQLINDSIARINSEEFKAQEQVTVASEEIQKQSQEVAEKLTELKAILADNRKNVENLFQQSEDFVHKENVKVYRNVQAAMVEELKAQTEALNVQSNGVLRKVRGIKPVVIITLVISTVNLAALVLLGLNILGYISF